MRIRTLALTLAVLLAAGSSAISAPQQQDDDDPIRQLVSELTLEQYKDTLKGLTQFGDRRQGTQRNRDAVDWIEMKLQEFGCTNTERIHYVYESPPRFDGVRRRRGGGQGSTTPPDLTTPTGGDVGRNGSGPGGSSIFGYRARTGVNRDLMAQPDERIRELNAEEPVDGDRSLVYCTKIGTTRPDQMYIIGAHMDGHGVNEAVNDDGSGTALVMELARVFHMPGVETDVSIRFALWNNEETGLNGARAYVEQRQPLQGVEEPAGSGQYPEPTWLGMIQHDMMLWDHGAPRADGTVSRDQRPEADVNIEFQSASDRSEDSMKLAFVFKAAADEYNTDYPATVGPHMTNTDSTPFMNIVPAISLRENERGAQTGAGWNPTWHTPPRRLDHVHRRRLPPRLERGADDAGGNRRAHQRAHRPVDGAVPGGRPPAGDATPVFPISGRRVAEGPGATAACSRRSGASDSSNPARSRSKNGRVNANPPLVNSVTRASETRVVLGAVVEKQANAVVEGAHHALLRHRHRALVASRHRAVAAVLEVGVDLVAELGRPTGHERVDDRVQVLVHVEAVAVRPGTLDLVVVAAVLRPDRLVVAPRVGWARSPIRTGPAAPCAGIPTGCRAGEPSDRSRTCSTRRRSRL